MSAFVKQHGVISIDDNDENDANYRLPNSPSSSINLDNQSNTQSNMKQLSPFESMAHPLFNIVCSYLTIRDGFTTLISINRSIKQTFEPSQFVVGHQSIDHECLYPHELFRQQHRLLDYMMHVLPYCQYASQLSIHRVGFIHQPPSDESALNQGFQAQQLYKSTIEVVSKALVSGHLTGLYIDELHEPANRNDISLTHRLIQIIGSPGVQLRELCIQLCLSDHSPGPNSYLSFADWTHLKHCNSLTNLDVMSSTGRFLAKDQLSSLFSSLPDSLEVLKLGYDFGDEELGDEIMAQLLSVWSEFTTWIPRLRFLGGDGLRDFPVCIGTAVMNATGRSRPMERWLSYDGNVNWATLHHLPLKQIRCTHMPTESASELATIPCTVWPDLHHISAENCQSPAIASLLLFASSRPIKDLQLTCMTSSLDEQSVAMLSNMHSLKCLYLCCKNSWITGDNTRCPEQIIDDDLHAAIPANCWSNLIYLKLATLSLSEHMLSALFIAVPNVRHIDIHESQPVVSNAEFIAMVNYYCRHVVRLYTDRYFAAESLELARSAFSKYSSDIGIGFPVLIELAVTDWMCDIAVRNFVISQICNSPKLQIVHLGLGVECRRMSFNAPDAKVAAFEDAICFQALPHLRVFSMISRESLAAGFGLIKPERDIVNKSLHYLPLVEMAPKLLLKYSNVNAETFDEIIHEIHRGIMHDYYEAIRVNDGGPADVFIALRSLINELRKS